MKFSKLEKYIITELCDWVGNANVFKPIRNFLSCKGLQSGAGLFVFSRDYKDRPLIILCIDLSKRNVKDFEEISNHTLFILHLFEKLERLGLVTISQGRYDKEKEYAIGCFPDEISVIGIKKEQIDDSYSFIYQKIGMQPEHLVLTSALDIIDAETKVAKDIYCFELFSRIEAFDIVSSNIALEQELFDLIENTFKTTEESMLETAGWQLNVANHILEEAQEQTKRAEERIQQAEIQFENAQSSAQQQFELSQAESERQFKSANKKSRWALWLALISILSSPFVAKYVETTIDETQYDQLDSVLINISNRQDSIARVLAKPDTTSFRYTNSLEQIEHHLNVIETEIKKMKSSKKK